jgi:preprotein translocase subunit SecY
MIIFINIVGGIPSNFNGFIQNFNNPSAFEQIGTIIFVFAIYLAIVSIIVLVQESYKKINIVSARQLGAVSAETKSSLKTSYIPIKLNQGGIMPLVFSTTVVSLLLYPLQIVFNGLFSMTGLELTSLLTLASFLLNIVSVIFFSSFYALVVLKPKELAENLTKFAYGVPGLRQGKETSQYLEQTISRLSFMGGVFLAFLALFPFVLSTVFHFNVFKNLTSLVILIGVITDVSSQIRGFLIAQNYESF